MTDHVHFYRLGLKIKYDLGVTEKLAKPQQSFQLVVRFFAVRKTLRANKEVCTLASPLISRLLDARTRASTIFFRSRCNLLWKSLNIVEPPDKTIFCAIGNSLEFRLDVMS